MAQLVSKPARFDALNLQVLTTLWEYAGDVQLSGLRAPLGGNDPFVKTLLTKGSIRIEFPGTELPDVIATAPDAPIFLSGAAVGVVGIQLFRMVTLEDNIEIQCVQPDLGYRVVTEKDVRITAGDTMPIAKGVMVFVFGDSYTVNGDAQAGFHIFAVQNNDIVVGANSNCRVIVYKSIVA